YHGAGIRPRGNHPTLVNVAEKLEVDVLLHGHTHEQEAVKKDGKILLNPGSCTGVGGGHAESDDPKMLILEVGEEEIEIEMTGTEKEEVRSFRI
ncbi:MAG: hypothetical protein BRC26_01995, partial [Nanohaloarchaea archaeon QH_8_44_6]